MAVTTLERVPPRAGRAPRRRVRAAVGLGAGLAAAALVVVTLGLATGRVIGAEDNGDGYRLFCGVGLVPVTVDEIASWKGGVVTGFTTAVPPAATCELPVPSSAALVLRAAAGAGGAVDLAAVGWWYAGLVGLVVAVAAWAASAGGAWRAAVLAVPVAPLGLTRFSRFFQSTYAEPAALLGTLAVACGVAALLVTAPGHRSARTAALVLVGAGGAFAVAAKPSYVAVAGVALGVLAVVVGTGLRRGERRGRWVAGAVAVLVGVAALAVPVGGALRFQTIAYAPANTHDVVFTLALTELGPGAVAALGLPPEAAAISGTGYFNGPPRPTDAWYVAAVVDDPAATRAAAYGLLAREPAALLRGIGVGLQATARSDLPYLAAGPADTARLSPPSGDPGWSGAAQPALRTVLDQQAAPWVPSALTLVGLAAGVAALVPRVRRTVAGRAALAAGLSTLAALGVVVTAVLGDGYFEIFKHVWLASYLLVLTAVCLVGALIAAGTARGRDGAGRRPRSA